jgi:hypothetical protein
VRKGSAKLRPGQALRGSSDLHGWGDSNLYLRRKNNHLLLAIEHRAAPSKNDLPVQLAAEGDALALQLMSSEQVQTDHPLEDDSPSERILRTLCDAAQPLPSQQLRKLCRIRTSTLCETLANLRKTGQVTHGPSGYALASKTPFPVPFPNTPIDLAGNGNGKPAQQEELSLALKPRLA